MDTLTSEELETALASLHRKSESAQTNLSRADTKASLLAAGAIPVTALLLAAPGLTDPRGANTVVAWTAAGFMLAGICLLGTVVWPRLKGKAGINWTVDRSVDGIVEQVLAESHDPKLLLHDAAEECRILTALARAKFRRIQAAMACFGIAFVFVLLTAVSIGQSS